MILNFEMRVKIFLLLAVICAFGASCAENRVSSQTAFAGVQNVSKEKRINDANNSVFCLSIVVSTTRFPLRKAIGTGFLISENLLATAAHVKDDLDKSVANFPPQKAKIVAWKKFDSGDFIEIPLKIRAFDKNSDMALYSFDAEVLRPQLKSREIKFLPLADRLPDLGEDILSIGYYGIMEFPFNSLGNVSMIDNGEDIYADMTLMPGNSGSPLVSIKTGEVLGLNVKVMTIGDGTIRLGIAKRISELKKLIEKSK